MLTFGIFEEFHAKDDKFPDGEVPDEIMLTLHEVGIIMARDPRDVNENLCIFIANCVCILI